jgi:DnaJ-class molecular chaperone
MGQPQPANRPAQRHGRRRHGIEEMTAMNKSKSEDASMELKCSACDGTGFPKVAQPAQPGRKIYPPPCKWCLGKGRVRSA